MTAVWLDLEPSVGVFPPNSKVCFMQSCLTFKSAGLMALRRLCLARPQFQALRAARFQVRPRADGEPHLDIGSRFGQVLKAEQEGDMKEMVASAKEVIQLGKALLDRSSDQSTGSLEQADVRQKMGLAHFKLGHVHDKHEHLGEEGHFQKGLEYLKEAAQERGNLQDRDLLFPVCHLRVSSRS